MTKTSTAKTGPRLIVALDVSEPEKALALVKQIGGYGVAFKIGLQLFTAAGPNFVRRIAEHHKVFLDLKFHDIPNTVARAAVEAARLGVWMFNVHASGGSEMMRRAANDVAEACSRDDRERPLIIGVTVLTSSGANTLRETGIEAEAAQQVSLLARLSADCGLDGVVASAQETAIIRKVVDDRPGFLVVTPGVRPAFATDDDQKRVMTPWQAISEGSDHLVIGRPILEAEDPVSALKKILDEIDSVEHA